MLQCQAQYFLIPQPELYLELEFRVKSNEYYIIGSYNETHSAF